jgi:HSP20 family protein
MNRRHQLKLRDEAKTPEGIERVSRGPTYAPRTDIVELSDRVLLRSDMPGVDEKSVDISLEKNTLRIHGKVTTAVSDKHHRIYSEYEPGEFERSFLLSQEVDREGIKAAMRHGVLEVVLPKGAYAQTRRIPVTVS